MSSASSRYGLSLRQRSGSSGRMQSLREGLTIPRSSSLSLDISKTGTQTRHGHRLLPWRYDRCMFSRGDAYDAFMGRWSRRLAPLLVRFAAVADGDDVLDVGSGTGSLTAAVAAAAPSSRIVGVDPSAPFIALAQ